MIKKDKISIVEIESNNGNYLRRRRRTVLRRPPLPVIVLIGWLPSIPMIASPSPQNCGYADIGSSLLGSLSAPWITSEKVVPAYLTKADSINVKVSISS